MRIPMISRSASNCVVPLNSTRWSDRALGWTVVFACLFVNVYFNEVEGINPNAHFAAIRSIVERGTFDITPLREKTYDVITNRRGTFSNKPPGLALLGAGPYWVMLKIEALLHVASPDVDPRVDHFNLAILTMLIAGIPAAATAGFF